MYKAYDQITRELLSESSSKAKVVADCKGMACRDDIVIVSPNGEACWLLECLA